ncbi:hypothetical protein ADL22_11415 [Streptomyces sp. NRRL F-4489]|uniref:hypothetical protein n=1 Tax=Streptomyces sp. NRRL F-4489 TaxID=1609095 RepID=UPI000749DE15|nr:hypothetical protein [Streptomyces sp. NRRL F-4489]KUL46103.1 hypothetical protein ADL22_11415 [Streptomyces sp. NRRL F-4489]
MASAPQLLPGVSLVTAPGGGLAVRTAEGEFLRVDTARTAPERLIGALTGQPEGTAADPELAALLGAFEDAGYAGTDAAARPGRLTGRTVLLLGDPALTAPLGRLVRAEGGTARPAGTEEIARLPDGTHRPGTTAVVWCLNSPVPEGLWDGADRLPGHRTAWLRCHREGAQVWLEPLADRPGDVTSGHVRLRRLAATPAHRELAAYWAGHRTPDTGPPVTETAAALIAALLTADLLAWAAGAPGPGPLPVRRRLRRLDLRDLAVTAHPVLPVPEVAPLPDRTGR